MPGPAPSDSWPTQVVDLPRQDSGAMLLFVGLGNPGQRYAGNRHNIGFMVVDTIGRRHDIGPWRRRFHGQAAEGTIGRARVMLLKPETYMNESGRSVAEAANFFKVPPGDVVVIHDEVDLPPGKLRVKIGGGVAGHNGLRSITAHIGNDYRRARIGVGRPVIKDLVSGYVLNDFAKSEREWVETLCGLIADNAELLARGEDASFQNKIHLAMDAKGFFKPESPEPSNDAQ
jgi:PTH1 family peptidyl-tRNA hydrolase